MANSQSGGWRDLRPRVISACVLVPVALSCIWAGGWFFSVMIVLVMAGIAVEGAGLLGLSTKSWRGVLFVAWPVSEAVAALLRQQWHIALSLIGAALLFGPSLWLVQIAAGLGGLSLLWLRMLPDGMMQVLFVILVVMMSDTTAYIAGRLFGGPKLAPAISPGKTWSGAIGGLVGATLAGVAVAASSHAMLAGGVAAAALGVVAQCGDLAESAAKRRLGVKDSGRLIPGHGGLLDRFDGLLAAAPCAAGLSLLPVHGPFWVKPWVLMVGAP